MLCQIGCERNESEFLLVNSASCVITYLTRSYEIDVLLDKKKRSGDMHVNSGAADNLAKGVQSPNIITAFFAQLVVDLAP